MSITEQEARERERAAYVRGRMVYSTLTEEALREAARLVYPDPTTYGPVVILAGYDRRRDSDGVWQAHRYGAWQTDRQLTDALVLALASCVPVTDAEVTAAVSAALLAGMPIRAEQMRRWLTDAREAMRPEDTR